MWTQQDLPVSMAIDEDFREEASRLVQWSSIQDDEAT